MLKQYLECGKIVTTQAVNGEVRVQPWCDSPDFLLEFDTFYKNHGDAALVVEKSRVQKNMFIVKFQGVDTVEAAAAMRGTVLYISRDDVALADGEYFVQDLIGCEVIDIDTAESYGKIVDVQATGANDVYHIEDATGRLRLVPVIPQVVLERDVEAGKIKIRPLEGLFDD